MNKARTESTLYKKNHIIAYHYAREAVAAVMVKVSKGHISTNLAELFTKTTKAQKIYGIPEKLHIERRIGACGFYTLVRVYHNKLTYLDQKEPN